MLDQLKNKSILFKLITDRKKKNNLKYYSIRSKGGGFIEPLE